MAVVGVKAVAVEEGVDALLGQPAGRDAHHDLAEAVRLLQGLLHQLLPRVGGVQVVVDDADVGTVGGQPVVHL